MIRDLTGQQFGKITVLQFHAIVKRHAMWQCRCECGTEFVVRGSHMFHGATTSCGCNAIRHGQATRKQGTTKEYRAYINAKRRCQNPKLPCFKDYGGRGIQFKFDSFEEFFAEVGTSPTPQHSIDRIDVNGNYEPGNVRWATRSQQQYNRRKD